MVAMTDRVTLRAEYQDDHTLVLSTMGVNARVVARAHSTEDLTRAAAEAAAGVGQDDVDVTVAPPPWLKVGQLVRLADGVDALDGASTAYAQVVGFLPIGGVELVHPESGLGIFPPEDFTVVDPHEVGQPWVERIVARSGITVAE